MFSKIEAFIFKHNLLDHHKKVVVGFSGGPDSLFLLHTLLHLQKKYNLTLIAAHLNHEWRQESTEEEQLCRSIAEKHNILFVTSKLSELSLNKKYNGSKEEYARTMRRHFFDKVLQENSADYIALGHHAQDQQETFFIRLLRGTSLAGLTAMHPRKDNYIRPLLETHKDDIIDWLHEHHITYAVDASNNSQQFLRNRIRSTVIPALHQCDNRFESNFAATLHRLKETELFLDKLTAQTFQQISSKENGTYKINIHQFFSVDPALHHRLIIHWLILSQVPFPITQAFLNEIMRFLQSKQGGTHIIHSSWSLTKKQAKAFIEQK